MLYVTNKKNNNNLKTILVLLQQVPLKKRYNYSNFLDETKNSIWISLKILIGYVLFLINH